MAVILWVMSLSLLMPGCLCSIGQTEIGCSIWKPNGKDVCCEACHPGYHIFNRCGQDPKQLCTPCEPGTFTVEPKVYKCARCTECVGSQVHLKDCTPTSDTVCGCREGLTCGDARCSFCVKTCGKGQEPTSNSSCRPCPEGTFNDKSHSKCKPWTKCPKPGQVIEAKGDAFTDIKCVNISVPTGSPSKKSDNSEEAWPVVLSATIAAVLVAFTVIVIIIVTSKILKKGKKPDKKVTKIPIIRTPTDDPRTLIAIECSFHEAQQEQGSSTESLNSKDSSEQLIA